MQRLKSMLLALVLAACLPAAAFCNTPHEGGVDASMTPQPGMPNLLNAYSAFADEYMKSVLRALRLLASTSEVTSGDWEKMKGLLGRFDNSGIAAAAVWYARPDGSYFTVADGLTGKTLSDRDYFQGLISGLEVTGDLVVSHSTGKRSAIFAVPVKNGDKTTGALGVSLSVEDMSRMLGAKMGLPQEYVFYALDSKGRTSLHGRPELLFEYPSDMGSETLKEAVGKMLLEREGVVEYEFKGRKKVYFKHSSLNDWVYALGMLVSG